MKNWKEIAKQYFADEYIDFQKLISGTGANINVKRGAQIVDYTDIEGDVKRRDLTINALFYDIDRGEIVDLVGGIADLHKKKIRTVGNATERFDEDPLRKLRALRFYSQLGGNMDVETLKALKDNPSLEGVSAERIRDEFIKTLNKAKSEKRYLQMLQALKFLNQILPDLVVAKPYVDENDYIVLLAYLLRENDTQTLIRQLNKLKYTNDECKDITFLVSLQSFTADKIANYKKNQSVTTLSDNQILEFGKLIGKNFNKFVKFQLAIKGSDVPAGLKGKDIGNWMGDAESKRFLNEAVVIKNFKDIFSKLPTEVQKKIYSLKDAPQNPKHHPEGNTLKHTIMVVNRALKYFPNDIDLIIAAIFHDIGKADTMSIHPKTGGITHYGHEDVSTEWVNRYSNWIESMGGNAEDVRYIVQNHMKMHNFDIMRLAKQRALQSHPAFDKLYGFSQKMDKGGFGEGIHEGVSEGINNPKITFLIGPPASGKSTWVSNNSKGAIIISRDDIVDRLRKPLGLSYGEAFSNDELQNKVNSELQSHITQTLTSGKDIVVDMTNMTKKGRHKILSRVPKNYTKNAVVFSVGRDELLKRLKSREEETGKTVPVSVVDQMIRNFQKPDTGEFDNITNEGITEGVINELAWQGKAMDRIQELGFPLTPKIGKEVYGDTVVTTFHVSDVNHIDDIKKIIGKKKSISTFKYMNDMMLKNMDGIRTVGGIIYELRGNIVADSTKDIGSAPDEQGRRWVMLYSSAPGIYKFTYGFKQKLKSNPITGPIFEYFWKNGIMPEMDNTNKAKFIAAYISTAEKYIIENQDDWVQLLLSPQTNNAWNEVLVNNIQVNDIIWTNKFYQYSKEQLAEYSKKLEVIAKGKVYFTMDSKDTIEFVKSRGGFTGNINATPKEYMGAAVGSEDAMKFMKEEVLNELAWEAGVNKFITQMNFPFTPKVGKALYGDAVATTFHITDADNFSKIKSLIGKKKSISSFTFMGDDMLDDIRGIQTVGGILFQLEAKIVLDSAVDAMSQPDTEGRRWSIEPTTLRKQFKQEIYDDAKFYKRFNLYWAGGKAMTQSEKGKFVADYITRAEKFLIKNKNKVIKELRSHGLVGDWNEVIVYDIKVKDVLWTNTSNNYYTDRIRHSDAEIKRIASELKQIATGTVYFTENPKDAIEFVKSRGGFVGGSGWDSTGEYKGAAVGSTNPKIIMKEGNMKTIMEGLSKKDLLIEELMVQRQYGLLANNQKVLLQCGGAYGHMHHPFDTEINLTFGDLKDIVKKALTGELELTREKTDGQALAISWVDGRLVAARNKSHLKNKGKDAMTLQAVADKFGGRGGLSDAYNFAMQDLSNAISALSEAQRQLIFKDGTCFMNLEVIYPTSVNVIPYNQALLVFHGTFEYDESGNIIGENQPAARVLAGMIKQVNQNVQTKYKIQGPPVIQLPKSADLTDLQSKYLAMVSKLQSEFGLSDSDGVADYHQAWWRYYIDVNAHSLPEEQKKALTKRWAFYDKSFRLKDIQDDTVRAWAEKIDKQDQAKIAKDNLMRFEQIFLGVGSDVLSFMKSVLTANPDEAKRQMVSKLDQTIKDVKNSGDPKKIEKLKLELQRLQSVGGFDKIVPIEGIVFVYKGNVMKLTGAFAACNQINGIFFSK